jgi:hypothetical protein
MSTERRLTIPTIGTVLTLQRGWTFLLFHESRNHDFAKKLGIEYGKWSYGRDMNASEVSLPSGTELIVDRVYIRKGNGEYDSITFRLRRRRTRSRPTLISTPRSDPESA